MKKVKHRKGVSVVLLAAFMLFADILPAFGEGMLTVNAAATVMTETVDMSGTLKPGEYYGNADVVDITILDKTKYTGGKSYTVEGDTDGTVYTGRLEGAGSAAGAGEDGVPTKGHAMKFEAQRDCTIDIVYRSATENDQSDGKKFRIVTVAPDGSVTMNEPDESKCNGEYVRTSIEAKNGYTYYAYRNKAKVYFVDVTYSWTLTGADAIKLPAFEGAEGGGRFATGGRKGDVYVVTSLEDYGKEDEPIAGTLRYGIENAPRKGRIIVFNVGGTIHLKDTLSFSGTRNITLAGQTAPGEGITIAGYDTNISDSKNLIIRFLHFRPGTENLLKGGDSMDALWGRDNENFIIDHCSFSWNTDECLSTYRGKDGTVQWCIISESLTVSGHSKGRHGYGGIFGGDNCVFQYNLITNHTSRNPRIGGGFMGDPKANGNIATLQVSNNVLYNYGYNNCYGGGYAYTNYINNYQKTGPGTREAILKQLINPGSGDEPCGFYLAGNVVEGVDSPTIKAAGGDLPKVAYEKESFGTATLRSAEEGYPLVLNGAGVTYPRRDAIDARVVQQVADNTGSFINTQDEVGGYCAPVCTREADFDSDMDGIPDAWETANGLNPNDGSDSMTKAKSGYAWVEVYFNELVQDVIQADYEAINPKVTIDMKDNTQINVGESVKVTAEASVLAGEDARTAEGRTIAKVEFFNGAEKVGEATTAPFSYTYTGLADGTYHISVRAIDSDGNATQSNTSRLHVNSTAGVGEWKNTDIGAPAVAGSASLEDGVMTVKSAGKIGSSEGAVSGSVYATGSDDDFHYVYQEKTGDIEIVTRLDSYLAVDNHTYNGLMFRESTESNAAAVGLGFTMVKVNQTSIWSAYLVNRPESGKNISAMSSNLDNPTDAGMPMLPDLSFKIGNDYTGIWLRLSRKDDTFTGYVSEDGLVWKYVGEVEVDLPDTALVGLAVDANTAANNIENLATAKFSNTVFNDKWYNVTYDAMDVEVNGLNKVAEGENLFVQMTEAEGYTFPESVEVTVNGEAAAYAYDAQTGTLLVENVTGDVVLRADGTKKRIVKMTLEEVDECDCLSVRETKSGYVLTHNTTTGKVAKSTEEPAVNQSYFLFPEINKYYTMRMKVKLTRIPKLGDGKHNGVFVGAFKPEDNSFVTVGFRANGENSLSGYFMKSGNYSGDGSPKTNVEINKEYEVTFKGNGNGGYYATWTVDGKTNEREYKANDIWMKTGDTVRYGIGIIGATVEISDIELIDDEGNHVYPGLGLPESADMPVADIYKAAMGDGTAAPEEIIRAIRLNISPREILDMMTAETIAPGAEEGAAQRTEEAEEVSAEATDSVAAQLAALEQAYLSASHITVATAVSDSAKALLSGDVTVTNAALSVDGGEVSLTVDTPEEAVTLDAAVYGANAQLAMKLLNDGAEVEKLTAPVTITMPVPTGVNMEKAVLLHYSNNGVRCEKVPFTVSEDNSLTFSVSHFSTFVLAEALETETAAGNGGSGAGIAIVLAIAAAVLAGVMIIKKRNTKK